MLQPAIVVLTNARRWGLDRRAERSGKKSGLCSHNDSTPNRFSGQTGEC